MNKGYSLTQGGILIAVAGTLLVNFGFSESCSTEIISKVPDLLSSLPVLIGGAVAWFARWRKGDLTLSGFRKTY